VDEEVARTLGELELKLRELERELTSIGQRQAQAGEPLGPALSGPPTPLPGSPPPPGGLRTGPAGTPPPPPIGAPPGRLVDETIESHRAFAPEASIEIRPAFDPGEAIEQRFSMESRETVYGEIPATKDRHEAIEIAELVRFKETMQHTLQSLIDQYSRLLSIEPPSHD